MSRATWILVNTREGKCKEQARAGGRKSDRLSLE